MENSYQDSALVQVIISIAKTFGMNSLAEGVETKSHMEKLYEMGCEEIQGYFISKPLPQVDFEKFVGHSSKELTMEKENSQEAQTQNEENENLISRF